MNQGMRQSLLLNWSESIASSLALIGLSVFSIGGVTAAKHLFESSKSKPGILICGCVSFNISFNGHYCEDLQKSDLFSVFREETWTWFPRVLF